MSHPFFNPKRATETTKGAAFPRTHLLSKPFLDECIKFLLKTALLRTDQESYTLSYRLPHRGAATCGRKKRPERPPNQQHDDDTGKQNLPGRPCSRCPISNQVCEQLGHLQFMPAMRSDPRYCAAFACALSYAALEVLIHYVLRIMQKGEQPTDNWIAIH